MSWSDASAICRLEWRRSRWLTGALCILATAVVGALWLCALPRTGCIVGSVLVPVYAGWLLYRESRRSGCVLAWPGGDAPWVVECDDRTESMRHMGASFRGGLVVLSLADEAGRTRRYLWWPDTLDAAGRRALRLAVRAPKVFATVIQPPLAR
jgi:toxin CptA